MVFLVHGHLHQHHLADIPEKKTQVVESHSSIKSVRVEEATQHLRSGRNHVRNQAPRQEDQQEEQEEELQANTELNGVQFEGECWLWNIVVPRR